MLAAKLEMHSANMDFQIEYRTMKHGDESQVFNFISEVFNQFVAPDFSQEGIDEFMKYIQPDALVNHLKSNHFGLIAAFKSEIIGAIVVRNYNHVALFLSLHNTSKKESAEHYSKSL